MDSTNTIQNLQEFIQLIDPQKYKLNEPLSLHTTVKIGGPADIWYTSESTQDFINTINLARSMNIPVTILGRGSNVLISDKGIRGIVIKNNSKKIQIGTEISVTETKSLENEVIARWESATSEEGGRTMYDFRDLNYDESDSQKVEVIMDSGIDMPFAINYLIENGITGLQWFSRIPGTLGGWIHNNAHGGSHFINEVIKSVNVLDENGNIKTLQSNDLKYGYDESRFHRSEEIILNATLELYKGDTNKAKYVVTEWAKRKSIQPGISVGCIFKNISQELKTKLNYPTTSAGYIIEFIIDMKGFRIGDATISLNHHNFIENVSQASAKDYLAIIHEIQKRTKEKLGIDLETEIFFLGEFD